MKTSMEKPARSIAIVSLTLISSGINTAIAQPQSGQSATQFEIQGAYINQQSADIDSGGDFGLDRTYLQASIRHRMESDLSVGLLVAGGLDRYDFGGSDGLGGQNPWSDIRTMRVGLPIAYDPDNAWRFFVSPSVRYNYEDGAASSDGQTWGVLGAAVYEVSETLSIGPGIGVFSQLDDDTNIVPILAINWKILPELTLETGGGFAASQGPGLQLKWQKSSSLTLTAGARYEKVQFRLDDKGIAAGGIGEDTSVPLYLVADYQFNKSLSIGGLVGASVGGRLAIEDRNGDLVSKSDYETAPFLGLNLKLRL